MTRERLRFALPRPVPPGLWRRVPPAVFSPILGALGLALAWLTGVSAFALPSGLAQLLAGMVVAVAAFALLAYKVKLIRRPGVLADDLDVLPGRAGLAAAVLSIYLVAAVIGAISSLVAGRAILIAGVALHAVLLAVLIRVFRRGPPEQRRVTPAWHLSFTGFIVAARAAIILGWPALAAWLFWPAALAALAVYAVSLRQARTARVPAPLRPLLAIHLAPLALFGTVALGLGWEAAGSVLAWAALAVVVVIGTGARWLLADGFSPLWGALTFPLAATAGLWMTLWQIQPTEAHRLIAGALLVGATLMVIPILTLILRDWARGRLPVKTNAAIA
ncbi:tellurium resistance protein [uncultured Paracoccus sp.]|uniref:SLAC1 family transporter n=1 Tax=uncultured Paracoccus sp. TaxID=189685 RepID=UPI002618D619|nr:tellurium resistance protein [uncultured Paracoccus sp.]